MRAGTIRVSVEINCAGRMPCGITAASSDERPDRQMWFLRGSIRSEPGVDKGRGAGGGDTLDRQHEKRKCGGLNQSGRAGEPDDAAVIP